MELQIDLLKTFLAIIDTGGFTNASHVVHRTQSAISMQVKRLEDTTGQPLFERIGRSVNLRR
jgi:DNA-binding transcriptional LysR family regulator